MTARLIATGRELLSEIDGFMLARGVDVQELSLDRFANVAYWWLFKDVQDRESREKLRFRLWMPPKGVVAESGPWSREAELASARALADKLGLKAGRIKQ